MAKKISDAEIPAAGGSYVRRKDGGLEVAHATEQAPAVQEHEGENAAPAPAPPPATSEES